MRARENHAGGHNAGHSVKTGGQTYGSHLLPSGLINPNADNRIGSGVVFNVQVFFKELAQLEFQGVSRIHERIHRYPLSGSPEPESKCHGRWTFRRRSRDKLDRDS